MATNFGVRVSMRVGVNKREGLQIERSSSHQTISIHHISDGTTIDSIVFTKEQLTDLTTVLKELFL